MMKFIEIYNKKIKEKNDFIEAKKKEIETNENIFENCKKELEESKIEYFKEITDETLNIYKKSQKALKNAEKNLEESKADLRQASKDFYFIYDPDALIQECKELYDNSEIDKELEEYQNLITQVAEKKAAIEEKWQEVNSQICDVTSKISALYLSDKERLNLATQIDSYANKNAYKLEKEGIKASHYTRTHGEILTNSIEDKFEKKPKDKKVKKHSIGLKVE